MCWPWMYAPDRLMRFGLRCANLDVQSGPWQKARKPADTEFHGVQTKQLREEVIALRAKEVSVHK